MIHFIKFTPDYPEVNAMIARGSYNQLIAIDEGHVYFMDRVSRAPRIGYDYLEKPIPFAEITRITIHPEMETRRYFSATIGILLCAGACYLLFLAFTHGIYILEWLTLLAPIGIWVCWRSYFDPLDTYFKIETPKRKYTGHIQADIWQAEGPRILDLARRSNIPLNITGVQE